MNNKIIVPVVIAIFSGVVGFAGGVKYQQNENEKNLQNRFSGVRNQMGQSLNNSNRMDGARNQQMGFRPISGEIIKKDDTSFTVLSQDGSSKIVLYSDNVSISKSDTAKITDLVIGSKVSVVGSANTDGSITAQSIQLNPVLRFMGQNSGTPSPVEKSN